MVSKVLLGQRIKEAVRRSPKKVGEIAREAGITPSSLGRITSGQSDPASTTLAGLARATGTTPNELLGFDSGTLEYTAPPKEAVRVGLEIQALPASHRRAVMLLVRSIKRRTGTPYLNVAEPEPRSGKR